MEKKKLPEIIIMGTIQELVEIETLLVMAGYDKAMEDWNNMICNGVCNAIHGEKDGKVNYHSHSCGSGAVFFASEIHKILHYIETGEIKEYCEDMQVSVPATLFYKRREAYTIDEAIEMVEEEIKKGLKNGTVKETGLFTHTGQTKVVGKRIGDKPYTLKDLMENRITATSPINPKYHVRDWKAVEKAFKEWANPDNKNCIAYYSPTSQLEILTFFKKYFTK